MASLTKTDIRKRAMIEALEKALGVVTTACKTVGISRETHYEWVREDESYAAAVASIGEMTIDFAESSLHKQIQSGNTAATIFYLKCKAKKRGYIEREEPIVQINTGEGSKIDLGGGITFEL